MTKPIEARNWRKCELFPATNHRCAISLPQDPDADQIKHARLTGHSVSHQIRASKKPN